jgi:DNA-binding NarL/FixJ family response regulator
VQKIQRILIVDQSALFRATLARYLAILDADYEVIGEAATDEAALREVARLQPQIVLLDLDLPDRSGLKTTRDIRYRWPGIAVIAITNHLDCEYCDAARAAGALNCLDKLALVEQLPAVLATLSAPSPVYLSSDGHLERPHEPP